MGTNMYPSSSLLGQDKDESIAALPVDELIEKADGFAGVFPGEQQLSFTYVFFLGSPTQFFIFPTPFSLGYGTLCFMVYIITIILQVEMFISDTFIFSFP